MKVMYYSAVCFAIIAPLCAVTSHGEIQGTLEHGKSSLVFVFDTTGSMYNDLEQLREGAELILDTALKSDNNAISNFVFVPYHDPGVGPATVTRDKEVLKAALNSVTVRGGGNCPEMSMGGIELALRVSLPRSYVYVFTDATAQDHQLVGSVVDLVQRKQSQVVFVLTGHCHDLDKPSYKVYQQVASASFGQIFNLNKTSVHKVLEFVRSSITGRTVNLESAFNKAGHEYTQQIPVDSTLGEVTVSVSGSKPQIKVVNPQGVEVRGPPKLVTTLDLSEIMAVKVIQPEPGNWTITVGSEEDYSVKVVGLSNLTFQEGFSVQRPKSEHETSYRPLQDTENYMLITVTKTDQPVDITYAEILTLDGNTLFELPLERIDTNTYIAKAFLPPNDFFYVAINGHDVNGQELRRISATAVEPKLPDAPYITSPSQISINISDSVVLRCNVESLVPVKAQWFKGNKRLQNSVSSLQSTFVDYAIDNMSEDKEGIYRCVARNIAGISTAFTNVTILVNPPQVSIEADNITPDVSDNLTISCSVYSESELLQVQLIANLSSYQKVINMTIGNYKNGYSYYNSTMSVSKRHSGAYTCRATNKGGEANKTIDISVKDKPKARFIHKSMHSKLYSQIELAQCVVENANKVLIITPQGNIASDKDITPAQALIYNYTPDIANVFLNHSGIWTCVAKGKYYNASDTFVLTVTMVPVVKIQGSKLRTLIYGLDHTVNCSVAAFPAPTILWYNDSVPITDYIPVTTVSEFEYISQLNLTEVSEYTEHVYHCTASNLEGTARDSLTIAVNKDITILERPSDQSVELYTETSIHCKVDSYPTARIQWRHNGSALVSNENVLITADNTTVTINSMDFADTGLYTCQANYKYGNVRLDAKLDVHGFVIPELSKKLKTISALRGNPVNISCNVIAGKPTPQITWLFENPETHVAANLNKYTIMNESGLFIPKVDVKHDGDYNCTATNLVGRDSHVLRLVVQYPPQVESAEVSDKNIEVETGNKVVLSCDAYAAPRPLVVWSKDNQPLKYSKNVYQNEESNLVVESASVHDNGVFTCTASNQFGSIHRNFTLFVYALPTTSGVVSQPEVEVLEGQLVELPCTANGHPKPLLRWTHDGTDVEENWRKQIDSAFTLRFVANLTDFGDYTCTAINNYGNSSYTYTVYIWVSPTIDPPLRNTIDVVAGSSVIIECDAVGFPIPTIYWEFQDNVLTRNTTNINFNDIGDLVIKNASRENQGFYICIADNIAGVSKKYTYLNINEPPSIIYENYSSPYIASNKDTSLSLPCRVTGKPYPSTFWLLGSNYLDQNSRYRIGLDGSLNILSPSEELSGNYTCVVKNIVGEVNRTVAVKIYSVPEPLEAADASTDIVVEHTSYVMPCPLRSGLADTLKWYKNGALLTVGPLEFANISRSDEGMYACIVANAVGSASASIYLEIVWPPRFVNEVDSSADVIEGANSYLDCYVDAKPDPQVKWMFNSKTLENENKTQLRLLNLKVHNSGTYACVVTNVRGTVWRQFTVNVLVPPHISDFDLLDVELKAGTNATLACEAKGTPKPTIRWIYNNTNWTILNDSLTSVNASEISEGLFRCDATNKAGSSHIVYRVAVVRPARVNQVTMFVNGSSYGCGDKVEVQKGARVRFACEADGEPSPKIQWMRNGDVLTESLLDVYYLDLKFDAIDSRNAGSYICSAYNNVGGEERLMKIDVLEPPKIYKSLFEKTSLIENETQIEIMNGQSFYLHCHPYGNPIPEKYWFKDDVPLRMFDGKMYSTEFGEIIVSDKASADQSGNYTCVARNKIGEESHSYLVNVLVPPPTIKDSSTKINSRVGRTVQLKCPEIGLSAPEVMWVRHPYTHITEELDQRIKVFDDNFTMTLSNVEVKDNGNYSCILTNKVGTSETVYELVVEKPPSILTNGDDGNVEEELVLMQRSVVLKCPAEGYPRPRISWLKDTITLGTTLSNLQRALDDSLLVIWNVQASDAGQYICVAENNVGADHRRFNVNVKVPGKWSAWSDWSLCNVTCGIGYQSKDRSCRFLEDDILVDKSSNNTRYMVLDEAACKGPGGVRRKCYMPPCEDLDDEDEDYSWSSWSKWSSCSGICGSGTQTRTRRCKSRRVTCPGDNVQIRKCANLPSCVRSRDNNSDENIQQNAYIPEATFILEPDDLNTEIEEFDVALGPYNYSVTPLKRHYFVNMTDNTDSSCGAGSVYNTSTSTCEDVDECLLTNNRCHSTQVCEDMRGGYRCSCQPGFASLGAGQRCMDMNECSLDVHGCEYACVNTAGGYVCACPRHLRLHTDRHRCVQVSSNKKHSYEELDLPQNVLSTAVDLPAKYTKKAG